jgi:hypothetical protein
VSWEVGWAPLAESNEHDAEAHGVTMTALIERYLRRLQSAEGGPIHPEVRKITGLAPSDIDARALYVDHLARNKYS